MPQKSGNRQLHTLRKSQLKYGGVNMSVQQLLVEIPTNYLNAIKITYSRVRPERENQINESTQITK